MIILAEFGRNLKIRMEIIFMIIRITKSMSQVDCHATFIYFSLGANTLKYAL